MGVSSHFSSRSPYPNYLQNMWPFTSKGKKKWVWLSYGARVGTGRAYTVKKRRRLNPSETLTDEVHTSGLLAAVPNNVMLGKNVSVVSDTTVLIGMGLVGVIGYCFWKFFTRKRRSQSTTETSNDDTRVSIVL